MNRQGISDNELTAQEAADALGYHVNHLYRLIAQGRVKGRKLLDRVWVFDQREIDRIKSLQDEKGRLND